MSDLLGACGLDCGDCGDYKGKCGGCIADSANCGECDIRACVVGRGLANCGECDDYACERIAKYMEFTPSVKETLDAIKAARA